jgi:Domain of unknown function (DUF4380)
MKRRRSFVVILMFVTAAGFFRTPHFSLAQSATERMPRPWRAMFGTEITASHVTIEALHYRGWQGALRITNGRVEAIVVPSIGRVMRFGWVGGAQNMLWENEVLDGGSAGQADGTWNNFGGDKVWPSPQSQWRDVTTRSWPPPIGFDSLPYKAVVIGDSIVLTSTVDPNYGIQTIRRISLTENSTVMTIASEFHKVSGKPLQTGVWIITQVPDAERLYAMLPAHSTVVQHKFQLSEAAPKSLNISGRLLSLSRNKTENVKIGMDARSLLWVGKETSLRIDAAAGSGEFPDNGCRTEIYTNADPQPYIEMETMGPLSTMKAGDVSTWSSTYTLIRRTEPTADEEAAKVFGLDTSTQ